MGCCSEKDYQEHEFHIQSKSLNDKASIQLSQSNHQTVSKDNDLALNQTNKEPSLVAEQELRQSPILGPTSVDFWNEEETPYEELEGDLLRVTHTNKVPINMEQLNRKKMENNIIAAQNRYSISVTQQKYYSPPEYRESVPIKTSPKITFGPLSTINEQESSLNETHRKSINQLSFSEHSQRRMF